MASIFARGKQLIAKVKKKFGGRNALVSKALQSPTPGAALRSSMRDNLDKDKPEVVDELLQVSRKHNLTGLP